MQVKEPIFSVSNMFTFNSQQYFKYFDFNMFLEVRRLMKEIVHIHYNDNKAKT